MIRRIQDELEGQFTVHRILAIFEQNGGILWKGLRTFYSIKLETF